MVALAVAAEAARRAGFRRVPSAGVRSTSPTALRATTATPRSRAPSARRSKGLVARAAGGEGPERDVPAWVHAEAADKVMVPLPAVAPDLAALADYLR